MAKKTPERIAADEAAAKVSADQLREQAATERAREAEFERLRRDNANGGGS